MPLLLPFPTWSRLPQAMAPAPPAGGTHTSLPLQSPLGRAPLLLLSLQRPEAPTRPRLPTRRAWHLLHSRRRRRRASSLASSPPLLSAYSEKEWVGAALRRVASGRRARAHLGAAQLPSSFRSGGHMGMPAGKAYPRIAGVGIGWRP